MFEKNMRLAFLLDFYADVLDDHSKSIMKAYYDDDLSLAEIASGENISRQGVRHIIKKCEEQLEFLESKLGLAAHFSELDEIAEMLADVSNELSKFDDPIHTALSDKVKSAKDKILSKSNQ